MAIYHMSVKTVGRSGGRSATGAAAYRAGERIECERYGIAHDYTRKQGVEHAEIFLPHGAPRWARERSKLWNTAEQKETRKNSTVAREFELALPHELNNGQRIELVKSFSERLVHRHRMAVDACIHAPDKGGNGLNHHAHILCSTRRLSADGFTEKTRELDVKNSGEVDHWREVWADMVNEHLQRASVEARVDHRTLEGQRAEAIAQGDSAKAEALNYEPTVHEGARVRHMSKRGIETNRARENAELEEAKIIHLEAFKAKQAQKKDRVPLSEPEAFVSPEPVEVHPLKPASFSCVSSSSSPHVSTTKEPPVDPSKQVVDAEYDGWSDQSVLDIWEDLKNHERGVVQTRAQRLQSKATKAIEALEKQQAAHEREKPQKGLLDRLSKRTGYQVSYEAWQAVKERLEARYKQLVARLKVIKQYVGDRLDHKGHNRASQKAEQIIRDRVPVFAGRVLRARLNRQKEAVELLKEKSVQRVKTIKKRISGSMSNSSDPNDPHALSAEQQRQQELETLQKTITAQQELIKNQRQQLNKQDAILNQQAQQINALSSEYQQQDTPNQDQNQQPEPTHSENANAPRVGRGRAIRMTVDEKTAMDERTQMNASATAETEKKLMQTPEGRELLDQHYKDRPDLQRGGNDPQRNHEWAQDNHPEAYASYMNKQKEAGVRPENTASQSVRDEGAATQKPVEAVRVEPAKLEGQTRPEQAGISHTSPVDYPAKDTLQASAYETKDAGSQNQPKAEKADFKSLSPETQKNFKPVSVERSKPEAASVQAPEGSSTLVKPESNRDTPNLNKQGKKPENAEKQKTEEETRLEEKAKIMAAYKERQKQHSEKQTQGKGQKI